MCMELYTCLGSLTLVGWRGSGAGHVRCHVRTGYVSQLQRSLDTTRCVETGRDELRWAASAAAHWRRISWTLRHLMRETSVISCPCKVVDVAEPHCSQLLPYPEPSSQSSEVSPLPAHCTRHIFFREAADMFWICDRNAITLLVGSGTIGQLLSRVKSAWVAFPKAVFSLSGSLFPSCVRRSDRGELQWDSLPSGPEVSSQWVTSDHSTVRAGVPDSGHWWSLHRCTLLSDRAR